MSELFEFCSRAEPLASTAEKVALRRSLRRLGSAWLALSCVLLGLVWTSQARADAQLLTLAWIAPEGCPAEAKVRADALSMVRVPAARRPLPLSARVTLQRAADGSYRALIETEHAHARGERSLSAATCAELGRAVSLLLALTLSSEEAAPATGPRELAAKEGVRTQAESQTKREGIGTAGDARRFMLGVDVLMGNGAVPKLGVAAALRVGLLWGPAQVELRASGFLPRESDVPGTGEGKARFYAGELSALACYGGTRDARLAFVPCAGADLAWSLGRSVQIAEPARSRAFWAHLFAEAGLRLRLSSRVALRLALQAGGALKRPRFAVHGRGTVYVPSAYTLRAIFGTEMYF